MRRSFDFDRDEATEIYLDPPAETCPACGKTLWVLEHRKRWIQRCDGVWASATCLEACRWGRSDATSTPVSL